jgi:uncharacterized membrane protein
MEGHGTPTPDDAPQGEPAQLSDDVSLVPVELEPALRPVAETLAEAGVPPEKQITILQEIRTAAISMYSGPLPSPATLQEYSGAVDNGAERIVARWEDASRHRESLERLVVENNLAMSRRDQVLQSRGQLIAGGLVVFLGLCGIACVLAKAPAVAITIFATTIIGVVSVFIAKRIGESKPSEQKQVAKTTSESDPQG